MPNVMVRQYNKEHRRRDYLGMGKLAADNLTRRIFWNKPILSNLPPTVHTDYFFISFLIPTTR